MKRLTTALALALALALFAIPAMAAPTGLYHDLVAKTGTDTGTKIDTSGNCVTAIVWSAAGSTASVVFEQSADGTVWYIPGNGTTDGTFTNPAAAATSLGCFMARFSRIRVDSISGGTISGDLSWTPASATPANVTTINNLTITRPASRATFTLASAKTFTVSKSLTLTGTDSTTMTFPTTSATIARTDAANTFTGTHTFGQIVDSGLNATYVPFAGTSGLISGYSGFTYVGATTSGLLTAPHLKDNSLTATYVPFASATGFDSYSGFTYAGTTTAAILTAPHIRDNSLTNTRVPFAQTTGGFVDDAALTFTTGTGTLATGSLSTANNGSVKSPHFLSIDGAGGAPTVADTTATSCGTTAATIVGKDQAATITVGATSGTSCTVTFGTAWSVNIPVCTASANGTSTVATVTPSLTTVIVAGTFTAGDKIGVLCLGY